MAATRSLPPIPPPPLLPLPAVFVLLGSACGDSQPALIVLFVPTERSLEFVLLVVYFFMLSWLYRSVSVFFFWRCYTGRHRFSCVCLLVPYNCRRSLFWGFFCCARSLSNPPTRNTPQRLMALPVIVISRGFFQMPCFFGWDSSATTCHD